MSSGPPESLTALVERFDASVFDAPAGHARIRLTVTGQGEWDVVVRGGKALLREASERRPDSEITADARAWRELGQGLVGGMDIYRAGRMTVRRDLHIGVGFLAATATDA
ncbi:MAG: hypothetical protein QOH38_376, partial [Thermoleophilaceae bacterium]|nr:hypothetical protein [Thermoleophilaceae bacterium]